MADKLELAKAAGGTKSVAMVDDLKTRAGARVGNLVIAIAASIGWVLGALLPEGKA